MADVVREKDLWVYSYRIPPETNSSIKMDVGIEDCLHIEFEYSKSKYHLKDVIVGRIYFLLVRLKIKHMELSIIRRETTGAAPNQYNESETLVRFEIMDGSPSRGETIPIRLFLGGFDLTPTFREVNKKYSTRYYLSLVLIDEGRHIPYLRNTFVTNKHRRTTILQAVRNRAVPASARRPDVSARAEQIDGSLIRRIPSARCAMRCMVGPKTPVAMHNRHPGVMLTQKSQIYNSRLDMQQQQLGIQQSVTTQC
jgi:hypothetical protein